MSYKTLCFLDDKLKGLKLKDFNSKKVKFQVMNLYFNTQDKTIKKELKRLL